MTTVDRPLPNYGSGPTGITNGPDGALWFTELIAAKIGRIATGGSVTEFPLPASNLQPDSITTGSDGALWFTEDIVGQIGRITTAGAVTLYPLPGEYNYPFAITHGPDGALWFTINGSGPSYIGRITTAGELTEYALPTEFAGAGGIVTGPDGALWFTEENTGLIGRITTAGEITEFPAMGSPSEISNGPDGALWFVEIYSNVIGRITTSGVVTGFPVGSFTPSFIALGPDGALWFTQEFVPELGRLTAAGAVTGYPIPNEAVEIVTGPNRALWFTELQTGRIGQLVSENASLSITPGAGVAGSPITLTGSGFGEGELVNVYVDSVRNDLQFSSTADMNGGFTATGPLRGGPVSDQSFVAVGQSTMKLAVASFNVDTSLVVVPDTVAAGASVQLNGFGFGGREEVYCGFPGGTQYATFANGSGLFSNFAFTIPSGTTPGVYSLACAGLTTFTRGKAYITVE